MSPPTHDNDTSNAGPGPGGSSRRTRFGSDTSDTAESVGSHSSESDTSSCADANANARDPSLVSTIMLGRPYLIKITPQFLVVTLVMVASLAFSIGTVNRLVLLGLVGAHRQTPIRAAASHLDETGLLLPTPAIIGGKEVPPTMYTSKTFQQGGALTSRTVHLDRTVSPTKEDDGGEDDAFEVAPHGEDGGGGLHLPSGQHLLVDIKHVDPDFLKSEERLAAAMIEMVNESKLTLLSYHCHSLVPVGVSCAGVLLESHVAFHTWPKDGVITMDLFTCGAGLLVPVVPMIMRLFGIPVLDSPHEPSMVWSHKLRGFREDFSPDYNPHENPLEQDLSRHTLANHHLETKNVLISERTSYQHVDVVEWSYPPRRGSSSDDGRGMSRPENRVLHLDGVEQSSLYGDAAYHEALVHPGMFAHPDPKRVAIIGGGEGATLREILKHKSVETVTMVELDEELVEICREHLPEWSDCSDMEGSDADSCFDDSRASVEFINAFEWFTESFGNIDDVKEEKYDLIVMDALDPDQFVAIVGSLYKDDTFINSLYNGLSEGGVFVVQLGESNALNDPAADVGPGRDRANMMDALENAGFKSMHIYDEGHSHFNAPWTYLVCFKEYASRTSWYKSAPELDVEMHRRLYKTKSGRPTLIYFDAPAMMDYQMPSRAQETAHCRRDDKPKECDEFSLTDDKLVNVEVEMSVVGEYSGRGLFATHDIPQNSHVALDEDVKAFHVLPSTVSVMEHISKMAQASHLSSVYNQLWGLYQFVEGYGTGHTILGKLHYTIDSGIYVFCNHGCNGTFNLGVPGKEHYTEMNIGLHNVEEVIKSAPIFSPITERHLRYDQVFFTLRDIKKGEEILCNYLEFFGTSDYFEEDILETRTICAGGMGGITTYELK